MATNLPGLFVVGTDTGVGKTYIAAAIARLMASAGLRVGALKPLATGAGCSPGGPCWPDADALIEAIGGGAGVEQVAPIRFEEPLAPPVAARRTGSPLEMEQVRAAVAGALTWWATRADLMVVEGIGGLLCPIAEGATLVDLAVELDYPLVIVARRGLGTLNHTLLTVEAAARRGLRVAGIVLNGAEPTVDPIAEATNPAELARRLPGVPLLAEVAHGAGAEAALRALPWHDWARPRRMVAGTAPLPAG